MVELRFTVPPVHNGPLFVAVGEEGAEQESMPIAKELNPLLIPVA